MKALVLEATWDPRPNYHPTEQEEQTRKAVTGSSVWRYPQIKVKEWPDPAIGPDDVLIEVKAVGICGSDMHFYETDKEGYILYPGLTRFPAVLGHEFSGRIVQVGENVDTLDVGDNVTCEEMIWCGHCIPCRNGFPNHCENLEEIGFTVDGAMARYIRTGAKYCWSIDGILERFGEEKGFEVAALSEPTSVAYNAMFTRAGGFKPGAYVAVFGSGPIGLAATGLAEAAGAGKIVVFEVSEKRRELARKVGADYVFDPTQVAPHEVLMELSHGEGFDFQVEAAGVPHITVPEMEQSLAINGKIVQIGRGPKRVPMYLEVLQVRRSQLFGAQGHSGHQNFPNVIRMVASGRLDLSPIITGRYALDDAPKAFERLLKREDGKIMIHPDWAGETGEKQGEMVTVA